MSKKNVPMFKKNVLMSKKNVPMFKKNVPMFKRTFLCLKRMFLCFIGMFSLSHKTFKSTNFLLLLSLLGEDRGGPPHLYTKTKLFDAVWLFQTFENSAQPPTRDAFGQISPNKTRFVYKADFNTKEPSSR